MSSRDVKKITSGLFHYTSDLALWLVVYFVELFPPQSSYAAFWRASAKANKVLEELHGGGWNNVLKATRDKGYIKQVGRGKRVPPEITLAGRKRLEKILPIYDEKRVWDKKLYLVTYDIAESRKKDRELLRSMIKQLGMGMLQKSVWVTPYNPQEILRGFLKERYLNGSVIISDIGKDGAVGESDLKDFIVRVYKLEKLNERYEEFLDKVKSAAKAKPYLYLEYLSILKDDPQLPFELLPPWWKGEEAYWVYKKIAK